MGGELWEKRRNEKKELLEKMRRRKGKEREGKGGLGRRRRRRRITTPHPPHYLKVVCGARRILCLIIGVFKCLMRPHCARRLSSRGPYCHRLALGSQMSLGG